MKEIPWLQIPIQGVFSDYASYDGVTIRQLLDWLKPHWEQKRSMDMISGTIFEDPSWRNHKKVIKKLVNKLVSREYRRSTDKETYKFFSRKKIIDGPDLVVKVIRKTDKDVLLTLLADAGYTHLHPGPLVTEEQPAPVAYNEPIVKEEDQTPGPDDPVFEIDYQFNADISYHHQSLADSLTNIEIIRDKMTSLLDLDATQQKQLTRQLLHEAGIGRLWLQFEGDPWISDFSPNTWMTLRELGRKLDAGTPNSGRPHTQYVRKLLEADGISYVKARESNEVGEVHTVLLVQREDVAHLPAKYQFGLPPIQKYNPFSLKNPKVSRLAQ